MTLMSISALNSLPPTSAPVEPKVQLKAAPAPTVAAPTAPAKADSVSISAAGHQAADGDHDAS